MSPEWGSGPSLGGTQFALHPDESRFAFWRPHAAPIQAALLRLTGWIEEDVERELLVASADGPLVAHSAEGRPIRATVSRRPAPSDGVLFRLEKPGTRERADWETYFVWVRLLQGHDRLVNQGRIEAYKSLADVDARILSLSEEKDRVAEAETTSRADLMSRAKILRRLAKAGISRGSKPSPTGPYARLRKLTEEAAADRAARVAVARDIAARFENLGFERASIEQQLRSLELRASRRVYAGLFGQINAFLDVQALSAASIAIEEFRKTPRRETAVVEEMEARLATD